MKYDVDNAAPMNSSSPLPRLFQCLKQQLHGVLFSLCLHRNWMRLKTRLNQLLLTAQQNRHTTVHEEEKSNPKSIDDIHLSEPLNTIAMQFIILCMFDNWYNLLAVFIGRSLKLCLMITSVVMLVLIHMKFDIVLSLEKGEKIWNKNDC